MNIKGLDYNTKREKLILPEYGREIQNMVKHAVGLPSKEERQSCAETIVSIMSTKMTANRDNENFMQMLWSHLFLISGGQLDIDWPYDMKVAEKIKEKPQPLKLPGTDGNIKMRHYGRLIEKLFQKLIDMPEGEECDELARITANHMKRNLVAWGHGSLDNERVISDLARFTHGKIQLDPSKFEFEEIAEQASALQSKKKKK